MTVMKTAGKQMMVTEIVVMEMTGAEMTVTEVSGVVVVGK